MVMYEELIHGPKRVKEFRSSDDPWWCMYKRGGQGLLNEGTSLAMPKWKRDAVSASTRIPAVCVASMRRSEGK